MRGTVSPGVTILLEISDEASDGSHKVVSDGVSRNTIGRSIMVLEPEGMLGNHCSPCLVAERTKIRSFERQAVLTDSRRDRLERSSPCLPAC